MSCDTLENTELASISIANATVDAAVDWIVHHAPKGSGVDVHLCNAYTIVCAEKDPAVHDALSNAAVNFPDGIGVLMASRLKRRPLSARVPGPDLMAAVLSHNEPVLRHFLLGSTPETLEKLTQEIESSFPAATIVGFESPPFRPLDAVEHGELVQRIKACGANVVWVGLGTPKQDIAAHRLAKECQAVVIAIGAAFDFLAGTQRRAPFWMRRAGFEWLFRLATEPRRLWRRYLFGNAQFLGILMRRRA